MVVRTFVSVCFWVSAANVAVISMFVGWLSTTWLPEGHLFATVIPMIAGGMPPPPLWGPWKEPLTPPVPSDLTPQPRPTNEILKTLAGTGDRMPANGLGLCCRPSAYDDETVRRTVLHFLLNGGRHLDTAQLYLNHKAVGSAIEEAMSRGVKRSEIWVTTKLHERFYDRGEEAILAMVEEWTKELKVDYLDMVLLHVAAPLLPLPSFTHSCKDWSQCRSDAWKTLAVAKKRGVIRNIGVSNFNIAQLEELQALDVAPIAANQFMINPFSPQWVFDIADFCQKKGIMVTAWAPLAGTTMQTTQALRESVVNEVAANHSREKGTAPSAAQVILRWALQKGYTIIPGSGNPEHIKENLAIYDIELGPSEMAKIDSFVDHPDYMYGGPDYMKPQ